MFPYIGEKAVKRFEEISNSKLLKEDKLYFNTKFKTYFKISSHGFLFTYKKGTDKSGKIYVEEYKLNKEGDFILIKSVPVEENELAIKLNGAEVI